MYQHRRFILALLGASVIAGPAVLRSAAAQPNSPEDIDNAKKLFDDAFDTLVGHFPEAATSLGVDEDRFSGLRSKLTDYSRDGRHKLTEQARELLDRGRRIDRAKIGDLKPFVESLLWWLDATGWNRPNVKYLGL